MQQSELRAKVCPKTVLAKKRLPPMSNAKTHQPHGVVATVGKDKKKYCNKYNNTAIIRAYGNYVPSLTHYSSRNRTAVILTSPYLRTSDTALRYLLFSTGRIMMRPCRTTPYIVTQTPVCVIAQSRRDCCCNNCHGHWCHFPPLKSQEG